MTSSVLDDLPGVGPARKRALLAHFGSPEAVLAASREQLEAVPGLPGKVARELLRAAQQDRPTDSPGAREPLTRPSAERRHNRPA